ncbi:MAG: glycosyltransferase [Armatimonadetes bacterium]|nr:glycosyltransferase [Armatimonadota bacterium]
MKVALFTNTYRPSVNGVANCTHLYRCGLEELGHEVHVFAPEPVGDDPFEDDPHVHRYPAVRVPGEVDYTLALPLPFAMKTFSMLHRLHVDVVHTQHPLWVGRWGQTYAYRKEFPLVSTAHTHYEVFADRMFLPEEWVAPLVTRQVVRYYNRCQVITTPVRWMMDRLREDGVTVAMEQVRNPVDLSGLSAPDRAGTRQRLGISEDEIVVGYLGRLSDEKNLESVVEAAAILNAERPGIRLLIVGDGPGASDVRRAARRFGLAESAIFTGAVPHESVADYHAAMDLFLTASGSETQPLAYTEAMYVGTPVIALATPGARDMIQHEVNGMLVEADAGAAGLAAAARRTLDDVELRRRIVRDGRQFAASCNYLAVAERLIEVYLQAARLFAASPRRRQ